VKLLIIAIVLLGAGSVFAEDVTLAWDANIEPDLAGYKLYFGTDKTNLHNEIDVGNVTQYKITGLNENTIYFFGAKAYDTSGRTSKMSEIIEHQIPNTFGPPENVRRKGK
jgi:hypothetical protein